MFKMVEAFGFGMVAHSSDDLWFLFFCSSLSEFACEKLQVLNALFLLTLLADVFWGFLKK